MRHSVVRPHVVHVVRSAGIGGLENHVTHLCRASVARGFRVTVISLVGGRISDGFADSGAEVVCLRDTHQWSVRLVGTLFQLARELRRLRPSIVHLHGIRPITVGAVSARLARIRPVLCTVHASYDLMAVDGAGRRRLAPLLAAKLLHFVGFSLCDRILVDCEALGRDVVEVFRGLRRHPLRAAGRKVRLAYNAVDVTALDGAPRGTDLRIRLGLGPDVVVFGTVSRLDEPKKGLGILLDAFAQATTGSQPAHLVISGDGGARRMLESRAESFGLTGRVSFLGYYPDLADVYRALDVFVLPSLTEGFPTVTLEAMSFSLPCVVTNVGGSAEAVVDGMTGFVVPAADSVALARAMRTLLEGPARQCMGLRGRARVVEKFDVGRLTQAVFDVYAELTESCQTPPSPDPSTIVGSQGVTRPPAPMSPSV